jgi:hypothetical protein
MATRRDKLLNATRTLQQVLHQGPTSGHVDDQLPDRHSDWVANRVLGPVASDVSDGSDADSASSFGEEEDSSSQPSESTATTTDTGPKFHLVVWHKSKCPNVEQAF